MRIKTIIKSVVVGAVILASLPVVLVLMVSTPWAQGYLRQIAETQLSNLLGTEVTVGSVDLRLPDEVKVLDVRVRDDYGEQALAIADLRGGFDPWRLVFDGKVVIDYANVSGLDAHLYKKTPDSPLNIAGIIERLTKKEPNKPPSKLELRFNTISLRNSAVRYDILSAPAKPQGVFDPNHIAVSGLRLDATLPCISNQHVQARLRRLTFTEKSGLAVTDLRTEVDYTPQSLSIGGITLEMPGTLLAIAPLNFTYDTPNDLKALWREKPVTLSIAEGSYINPADLKALEPSLAGFDQQYDLALDVSAMSRRIELQRLDIASESGDLELKMAGEVDYPLVVDSMKVKLPQLELYATGEALARITDGPYALMNPGNGATLLRQLGNIDLTASFTGNLREGELSGKIATDPGAIDLQVDYTNSIRSLKEVKSLADVRPLNVRATITSPGVNLSSLLPGKGVGVVDADIYADISLDHAGEADGTVNLDLRKIVYKGRAYTGIMADAEIHGRHIEASLDMDNDIADISAQASVTLDHEVEAALQAEIRRLNLGAIGAGSKWADYTLSTNIEGSLSGIMPKKNPHRRSTDYASILDRGNSRVAITDFHLKGPDKSLAVNNVEVTLDNSERRTLLSVASDYINGQIEGNFAITKVPVTVQHMLAGVMPVLLTRELKQIPREECELTFDFTVDNTKPLERFFNLPVGVIYPISIYGGIDSRNGQADVTVDVPYLAQGNKVIENTAVHAGIDRDGTHGLLYATTQLYTKKGLMPVVLSTDIANNRLDTRIDWQIERQRAINGIIDFSTLIGREDDGSLCATININPGTITFGDTLWEILPSEISVSDDLLTLNGFGLSAADQKVTINGRSTRDTADDDGVTDRLTIDLENLHLIDIFETLEIENAMLGGIVTGTVEACNIYTRQPLLTSPGLKVQDISYNRCVLGDAQITADWNREKESFQFNADVEQPNRHRSRVYGDIFPSRDSLDLQFDADRINIGFMQTFMQAFASDVGGEASGHARLWGNFKYIDMDGDINVDSLRLKINFTNTYYTAHNERISIRPHLITLDSLTIYDIYRNRAFLSGELRHNYFKDPEFDFRVFDAKNFLSYDVNEKISPRWWGRIFGNGSAFVKGKPGHVDIKVNMTTAPKSTFTFALLDQEEVWEYNFITFRDKTPVAEATDIITAQYDDTPEEVKAFRAEKAKKNNSSSSNYDMDIQVDITPEAQIIIIMDPIGGDRITSKGSGHLGMTYGTGSEELRMWGKYILDGGHYNFTLQDIIIKEFDILEGSSINFEGDPYAAKLDINAIYQVNANLSDLDESFLYDRDLTSTRTPVNAVLKVRGDMRQPDIAFDLDFPKLKSDTYRKVRSIISTDDMMSRQIIYLLALSRFYTPDYMGSTTKGNELFSVASSTITSQLTNMLGHLADNWTIAPTLRSDAGDFSDVEVDVALSSSLLNNRLLFNGNFGYRDKSLNTNQFIGDFDLQYLLTPTGTWRLKAYNRYNDQNYYLRSATTTQGVGIMFRRDFDKMFNFLHRRKKDDTSEASDSIPAAIPTDSIPNESIPK